MFRVRVIALRCARLHQPCTACERICACHVQGMYACARRVCIGTLHRDGSVYLHTPAIHCNTSDVHVRASWIHVRVSCAHLVRSHPITWEVLTHAWTWRVQHGVRRMYVVCEICARRCPGCSRRHPRAYRTSSCRGLATNSARYCQQIRRCSCSLRRRRREGRGKGAVLVG